jgi:hypothetical protein
MGFLAAGGRARNRDGRRLISSIVHIIDAVRAKLIPNHGVVIVGFAQIVPEHPGAGLQCERGGRQRLDLSLSIQSRIAGEMAALRAPAEAG